MQTFLATALLGLLLVLAAPVRSGSAGPASPALLELASQSKGALLVEEARALGAHLRRPLDLIGFSFPELGSRHALAIPSGEGVLRLLDPEALERAGIPGNAPLALLRPSLEPTLVLAVAGLSAEACASLRTALQSTTPAHAEGWQQQGVCLVGSGPCANGACAQALKPGRVDKAVRSALEDLPREGVRGVVQGTLLARLGPRQAAKQLQGLDAVVFQLADRETVLSGEAWALGRKGWLPAPGTLLPLGDAVLPTETEPVLEITTRPAPRSLRRLAARARACCSGELDGLLGPDAAALLTEARPRSLTLAWHGVDDAFPVEQPAAGDDLFTFHGALYGELPSEERAGRLALKAGLRLAARGFTAQGPFHHRGPRRLALVRAEQRLGFITGVKDAALPALQWRPAEGPAPSVIRVRANGRRILRALDSISLLHGAANPVLRGALGARELLGPTLQRMGDVSAWAWPVSARAWRVRFEVQSGS